MKRFLPATFLLFFAILFFLQFSKNSQKVQAETASHVVISEIQTGKTGATTDEFVELYNPTSTDIDLSGWRLTKKNSSGNETNLVANISGTIKAYGYFLIAHSSDYSASVSADIFYSAPSQNIANTNNTAVLYSDSGITQVDLVGFGSSPVYETEAFSNPPTNGSIERKGGGDDESLGNGEDTDNNANDFVERTTPDPQNSNSAIELPFVPTPTPTPTNTPSPTPTPTSTPTPTPSSASDSSTSSDSSSASSSSCSDSKPGSAPTLLSATPGINSVLLRWSQASDPVSYYLVSYGLSSGVYTYGNPNVGGKGTTSYTVNGLSGSTTYYFKVRAGNGCSPGDFSNELSATPFGNEVTNNIAENFTEGVLGAKDENAVVSEKKTQKESVKVLVNSGKAQHANSSPVKIVWDFMSFSASFIWRLITKIKFF